MISRRILAALALLCAFAQQAHAQPYTRAQLNAQVGTNFPDQNAGAITPQNARVISDNIVNSIMPTAPVVGGNLACFSGTTGLLQDCGVAPSAASILYTAPNGVARTVASKLFESTPSIVDWGGLGNNSQDNATAFNTALANVSSGTFGTGVPYAIMFPQGTFLIGSKPNVINLGVNFVGVNKSSTGLVRNYSEATATNGLFNFGLGASQVPSGSRLENMSITAANATTGGSGISIIASNSPHGPDFLTFDNLFMSYTGTGAYSASGATLYIDGSAATSAPLGSRDIKLHNVELFSNGWPAALLKGVVDFEWYGGNIAGLATDTLTITGTTGVPSTGVNINVVNMDAIEIDHANSVHIRANAIQGAVTIDSTALGAFVESDQAIGGTVTVNSTTSCVRSQVTWTGSGCWIFQNLTITGIFDSNAINHATSVQVTNGAAAQAMNGKSFCATGVFANCGSNSAGTMQAVVQAFASLTACGSTTKGSFASVSDSTTVVWGATITGGGTNEVLANCNGSAWTVAGK